MDQAAERNQRGEEVNEVQIIAPGALTHPAQGITAETALALWLRGFRSLNTRAAYRREMQAFADFTAGGDVSAAINAFLDMEDGPAHALADAWRQHKIHDGKAASTVNRSLATLSSFVRAARRFGVTKLHLDLQYETSMPYRDTKGPGVLNVSKMIKAASAHKDQRKALRDVAILKLAFYLGMRRGEIASLNIEHVDLAGGTVSVLGKGRSERVPLTTPPQICEALSAWLGVRSEAATGDPLFIDLSSNSRGSRLTGTAIYYMVVGLGKKLGIKARPHGLRHSAITAALDAFDGNFRKVKRFSRHRSSDTVEKYDDNRTDYGGQVSAALCVIVE